MGRSTVHMAVYMCDVLSQVSNLRLTLHSLGEYVHGHAQSCAVAKGQSQ
jgi:hypothetical protein